MKIEEIKKELLEDRKFMEEIYRFIQIKMREEFDKEIKKSLVDGTTTNDNEN